MSLLVAFVGPAPEARATSPLVQSAVASAQRMGHDEPTVLAWQGGHALWFATPGQPDGGGACVQQGPRFAACVGTMHWQGLGGAALLQRLLADCDDPRDVPWRDISGGCALLFGNGRDAWLCGDAVGLQRIYANADRTLLSTSLLLCRGTLARPRLHRLRAQEYVLLGSNHAHETPIDGVQAFDPTLLLDLRSGATTTLHAAADWRQAPGLGDQASAVDAVASMIAADFRSLAQAHGKNIGMALSGGFDSRLLLAALDHAGLQPRLYVYGAAADDDVRIAVAKAGALGLPIEHIDKRQLNAGQPPLDRGRLAASQAFFDGLPIDGIFDRGADRLTRLQQVQGGMLNLNGGGGEILRNFFYLPDRGFSADDLVGAFYSNWLPRALPTAADRQALRDATADGILRELGLDHGSPAARQRVLQRRDVELVYTVFRLRYWMARNNSVASTYGAFMTPLVHPRLVALAAALPLAWKTHGDFEAAVIATLSPRVAAGPSSYGFDFATGPTSAHRRHILATLRRPIALRRRSARIRRLLGRNPSVSCPAEWTAAFAAPAVDWIDTAHLTDLSQWNRLLSLQALLDDSLVAGTAPR